MGMPRTYTYFSFLFFSFFGIPFPKYTVRMNSRQKLRAPWHVVTCAGGQDIGLLRLKKNDRIGTKEKA